MLRYIGISMLIFVFTQSVFSQEVSGFHDVQPGSEPNEYTIKTTINGLQGVDIARIKYIIDNKHTYKASPNNALFSDRNESYIKFYIMAVPATGELSIELGVIIVDGENYTFPVEFQYSKNEEKKTLNLPQINISGSGEVLAVVEEEPEAVPEPVVEIAPVVEEEPETVPEPEAEVEPVVEEEPEAVPEPEAEVDPVAEEEPEAVPEPIVEIAPVVEEAPEIAPEPEAEVEPVVEEEPEVVPEPVVEESPEPVVRIVKEVPLAPVEVVNTSTTKYTVQLLSLAKFSQARLNTYCRQHNLSVDDVKKNQVGKWMKITYGEANSLEAANQIRKQLMRDNNIDEAFVTPVK